MAADLVLSIQDIANGTGQVASHDRLHHQPGDPRRPQQLGRLVEHMLNPHRLAFAFALPAEGEDLRYETLLSTPSIRRHQSVWQLAGFCDMVDPYEDNH